MENLRERVAAAVAHFWSTRTHQGKRQGGRTGRRDYGNRAVATGGRQLDGFCTLVADLIRQDSGVPSEYIFTQRRGEITLPGFFRPSKQWDVVVVAGKHLLASIEFKALCGPSFGNNYNNRVEEALGSSTDIWTAYREGAFDASPRPFLGYVLLVEESPRSLREVSVHETHFPVLEEFRDASYVGRCEWSLRKLVRERCYSSTSLILTPKEGGVRGDYSEPAEDLDSSSLPQACALK